MTDLGLWLVFIIPGVLGILALLISPAFHWKAKYDKSVAEIARLKAQLREAQGEALAWREVCEDIAGGRTA